MLKIEKNKYVVYNYEGLIVLLTTYKEEGEALNNVYCRTYLNNKNLSNEYIENNLDKSLGLKDKIKAAYKRSIFNRNLTEEVVLAGEILKPVYLGQEVLKIKEDEITRMIRDCLKEGKFVCGFEFITGVNVCATDDELRDILKGFEKLENEHKKRVTIKSR